MPWTRAFANTKGAYALGGCSCCLGESICVRTISIFVPYTMDGDGISLQGHAFTQDIWLLDESAGAAEWQILGVPITDSPHLAAISGREGSATMLKIIAASTITACHLMQTI